MSQETQDHHELSDCLLEIGCLLMCSGAGTNRIRITIDRIAEALGYETEILVTHRTVMLQLYNEKTHYLSNRIKRTPPHGANLNIVSGLSRMSWNVVEQNWGVPKINQELDRLKKEPKYSLILATTMVAFAGAAFCRLFGGEWLDMTVAFVATFLGFSIRHYSLQKKFNNYISVFSAAFTATFVASAAIFLGIGNYPDLALATSVLFLIPGIPFINSFSDLIDGYIMNGLVRGTNAMLIAFCIALGMLCNLLIFNINI